VNQAIKEFGVELRDNDIDSIGEGSETRERAFDCDTLRTAVTASFGRSSDSALGVCRTIFGRFPFW
jgi:hypothetical protein